MNILRKLTWLILCGVLAISCVSFTGVNAKAEDYGIATTDSVTDILFIGNSMTYYNTLCDVVEGIATRKGQNVNCTEATTGGKNLIYHATADNVLTALKKGGYEVVVIQDVVGSFNGDRLMEGANLLVPIIKQYNPDAQIVFYEPWPVESTLNCEYSLMPYFTENYVKAAKAHNALLAPAGETFYDVYVNDGLNYYCGDGKHPKPLGTFVSAATIYYTIFEEPHVDFTTEDQSYLDKLIIDNIAYTNEGVFDTYSLDTLNLIMQKAYKHATAAKSEDYQSIAGVYRDPDEGMNPDNLVAVVGKDVEDSFFTKGNGNLALKAKTYASTEKKPSTYATDGDLKSRWESDACDPQWLYVDLGSPKEIKSVGFKWETAYAKKYYIQISDNATDWKTVAVVTASSKKTTRITLSQSYNTRYVRVYGTKRGTSYGYSFYEMAVWGTDQEFITVKDTKIKTATKKANSKKAKITLKKVKKATGYEVKYSDSKKFKQYKIKTYKKNTFTIKKLKKNTKYYIKVRAYRTVNNRTYYSQWTKKKVIKMK